LEKKAEQVLPSSEGDWGKREETGDKGEKWPK
jgi:hypothetical protein